jgi:hypothetical protein
MPERMQQSKPARFSMFTARKIFKIKKEKRRG